MTGLRGQTTTTFLIDRKTARRTSRISKARLMNARLRTARLWKTSLKFDITQKHPVAPDNVTPPIAAENVNGGATLRLVLHKAWAADPYVSKPMPTALSILLLLARPEMTEWLGSEKPAEDDGHTDTDTNIQEHVFAGFRNIHMGIWPKACVFFGSNLSHTSALDRFTLPGFQPDKALQPYQLVTVAWSLSEVATLEPLTIIALGMGLGEGGISTAIMHLMSMLQARHASRSLGGVTLHLPDEDATAAEATTTLDNLQHHTLNLA
jgi:hypothetical protein